MKNNLLVVLLIALSLSSLTFSRGNEWDLFSEEFTNKSLQPTDLEGWEFTGFDNNNRISNCGDHAIVGGYMTAGKGAEMHKVYQELPKHYKVKLLVTVYFVDSWDREAFQVWSQDNIMFEEISHLSWHQPLCGNSAWGERIAQLEVEFAHNAPELDIRFKSTLNQGSADESWGVRDVALYVKKCDVNCQQITEEFTKKENFDFDGQGWVASKNFDRSTIATCDGHHYLGGYGKFSQGFEISKTFEDLPAHYKTVISFDLWQIDSWDGNEGLTVYVDGYVTAHTKKTVGYAGGSLDCQGTAGWKDARVIISVEVPHHRNSLTLSLKDTLNQASNDESWGISNLRVFLLECADECQEIASELNEQSFNSDSVAGWVDENGDDYSTTTACDGTSLVGGFNELSKGTISKTFDNLPEHTHLYLSVEVWFIDHWNGEDFTIAVDQVSALTTTKSKGALTQFLGNKCGDGSTEEYQLLFIEVPHFGSSATIDLISTLNQNPNNESWGFRDVKVYVEDRVPGKEIASEVEGEDFAANWEVVGNQKPELVNQCGNFDIYGGNGVFNTETRARRVFEDLPEHSSITIYFKVYYIDQWSGELFQISVDNLQAKQLYKYGAESLAGTHLCGSSNYDDQAEFVEVTFRHSAPTLEIIIETLSVAAGDEAWGIRDFHLYVGRNSKVVPDCPTIYEECGYRGRKFEFCDDVNDFNANDWKYQVRSVFIPEGWEITLYNQPEFDGETHTVSQSIECMENGPQYSFLQVRQVKSNELVMKAKRVTVHKSNNTVEVSHKQSHLRHNKNKKK